MGVGGDGWMNWKGNSKGVWCHFGTNKKGESRLIEGSNLFRRNFRLGSGEWIGKGG